MYMEDPKNSPARAPVPHVHRSFLHNLAVG
jgi:hypothetical protein